MTTNTHILTINDRISTAMHLVRSLPDSSEKQILMNLLADAIDQLMEANTDMRNVVQKMQLLSERMATMSHSMYAPVYNAQFTYPAEGDYNAVREYVEYRKEHDEIFRNYCITHGRKQLCNRLSDEFGWPVDAHSYTVNLNRNKYPI